MRLLKITTCFAMMAALAFASTTHADELGGDLGFEDGDGIPAGFPGYPPGDWFGFTGPGATGVGTNTVDPRSGTFHADIVINGAGNSFAGIQQEVAVTVGELYTFSFWAKTKDSTLYDVGNEYRIEWHDNSGGPELSRDQLTNPFSTGPYAQYSVSGIAPAGATKLRAVVALQSFQGGTTGTAQIDDTSIQGPTQVPEPGSLALLGLASLGLVSRRRRN